jgi:EAL domain-containing protein (putative c-di-GMP-specific phosphodiesterase class I)
MRARLVERLQLEADLRVALEREELEVYYQPVVSLWTDRIAGFEALVRWRHPERGLISPAEFIPVAEETGMIVDIDRWVLQEACRQVHAWQREFSMEPPLGISVNLSSRDFAQPDLVEQVKGSLEGSCLEAGCLKLEITEGTTMEDIEASIWFFRSYVRLEFRCRSMTLGQAIHRWGICIGFR